MQLVGAVLLVRILLSTLVLDQIAAGAIERRIETVDLGSARQSLTQSTIEAKSLFATQYGNGTGVLLGARLCTFLTPNIFLGGAGYYGRLLGTAAGAGKLGYGGLVAGAEVALGGSLYLEGSTLFGISGADFQSASGPASKSGLAVEPQIALVTKLTRGVRAAVQGSYLSLSGMDAVSGWTASVAIEFRNFNLAVPD